MVFIEGEESGKKGQKSLAGTGVAKIQKRLASFVAGQVMVQAYRNGM